MHFMQSFLIKLGKAINVLKRDGFILGLRRIFRAFSGQFRKVDDGDVLFVTGGVGDSAMYRAENVAEELDQNGILASVAYADSPFLLKYADSFKVFIFHRVAYTKKIQKFIEKIKQQKKEIIFDTDDLLYDAEFIKSTDYFKNINVLEKKLYENGLGSEIVNDPYVKTCTTATSFLAEKLREKNKKVFVVQNKLSQEDVAIASMVIRQKSSVTNDKLPVTIGKNIRIGYFSGTLSHNKDFATITDALMRVMEKHENVELVLVGPLDTDNILNRFNNRTTFLPYVPREDHFENLASVDINLAPLVLDDPYCEAKSELKFFEAAIVGVPTVAVANRTFSEAISDGVDGFLAKDTDEWVSKLEKLILEPNLRQKMAQKASQKAIEKYTTKNGKNEEYYEYLKSRITSLSSPSSDKFIK